MTEHPITPPPELVRQWIMEEADPYEPNWQLYEEGIATRAAQWGADQELEACCEWMQDQELRNLTVGNLRADRRPKPPSLKEQALYALDEAESSSCLHLNGLGDTIRRALEALPDD